MTKKEYAAIEAYMLSQMKDSTHDKYHIYRVLNAACDISNHVDLAVDMDVLIAACLLHDIGRPKQAADPKLCHAKVGSEMAYEFLLFQKWELQKVLHVKDCIATHRFRRNNLPQSIEAKILFDADKLDICGAMGIARTLTYSGQFLYPIYVLDENSNVITKREGDHTPSFFQEYNYKLNIYNSFFTEYAKEVASKRKQAATDFYNSLLSEITFNYEHGIKHCAAVLNEEK